MNDASRIEDELTYVRKVVSAADRGQTPAAIYLMWALICVVGFPLADFAHRYIAVYWMIAAPVGTALSAWLGWRHSRRVGQVRRETGIRHGMHWIGTIAVVFLVVPLGVAGDATWDVVHRAILLVLALSYYLAGVHLDRPILWVGLLMVGAYVALFYIHSYQWTIVGVAVAVALAAAGLFGGRGRAEASQ
jgi:hypothetical protein